MGCCLSSAGKERRSSDGGATLEEEAVKEVVLQTPLCSRKPNADEYISGKGPGKQELDVGGGGFAPSPLADVLVQTSPQKLYSEGTVSQEVSNDNECYCNTAVDEKNGGEINQSRPVRIRRQPVGGKKRVPPRTPVAPEKTSQVRPLRGGQLRNEGSVQRSRHPMTHGGRETLRSGEAENSGRSNGVPLGEEPETLENPVVSLECFIFL